MIRRFLPLLLLVACKSEQTFDDREARLAFSPSLVELGDVPVGLVAVGEIQVDHLDGPAASVVSVGVRNLSGEAFSYEGPDTIPVERGGSAIVPVTFAPLDEGWFVARVEIGHDGLDSPAVIDVRGHGFVPDATLTPTVIDFGLVPVGSSASHDVVLTNASTVDLVIGELAFSDDVFSATLPLPHTIGAGDTLRLAVSFAPTSDQPDVGELVVRAGDAALPTVHLRGNDCVNGLPEAYDVDGDGVTSCAGDCDDTRADVRPGLPEVGDDVDNDCDGDVDEDTPGVDDDGDGLSEDDGDCNDNDRNVNPTATEILANGIDDDCDGVVDAGTTDADLDGYDPVLGGDCNDADPTVHPGAPELVDGIDNDCDYGVDEGTQGVDLDGDGYCALSAGCTDGSLGGDCDDTTMATHPGAPELPDRRDNDCDGSIDEGTATGDDDGDGYTEQGGDCDDGDPLLSPGLGTC
ncbi:MAG: choice-of-anchor D domain-containing protein [Alphaproteobacteria bacterium]|nr:choice-of-anchor D domain-containing protein [Alphaproteobacteria bacterium]MCB9695816.1 choice-of-anchor D domain-containing protein [Alphaproteobacteria bacterium]